MIRECVAGMTRLRHRTVGCSCSANLPAATRRQRDTRYTAIHPIHLKTALEEAQTKQSAHATRSHSAEMQRTALGQVPL
jgi:hypothetical protein